MEKCITDFLSALSNIDENYITVIGLNAANEEYQQAAENAFSAELYHQYKSIIENDKKGYYQGLQLHFDLTKQRFNFRRPDMVLHKAPDSRLDQRLYIEIKTNRTCINYDSDFEKIFLALSPDDDNEQLGYSNAIFLSVKSELSDVYRRIQTYIETHNFTEGKLENSYSIHLGNTNKLTIKKFSELLI